MKSEYTTFDTATDGGFKPTPPGIYPAHVSSFDSNPWNESVVFNLIFKLADDVKEVQVPTGEQNGDGNFHVNKDDDGKTIDESGGYLAGRTYRSSGVWFTPAPGEGQGWKNRKYRDTFTNLNVEFPTENVDGKNIEQLAEVEETDVIGQPCLVKVANEQYEKDGEMRTTAKVVQVYRWTEGSRLSAEEVSADSDLPF